MRHPLHPLPLLLLLTHACVAPVVEDPAEAGSSSASLDGATTVPPPPPPTTSISSDSDPSTTTMLPDPETSAGSSTGPGGLGEGEACVLERQECAPGLKCMPYSTDGSGWWNEFACFPIDADPVGPGEPCQWFGGAWSGYDDCEWGQVCWAFDEGEPSECKDLCLLLIPEDDYSLGCTDPLAALNFGCQECFCVCEIPCSPLAQDCGDGQECLSLGYDFFECVPDASGDMGAYGDPCEFINVCDPGLMCLYSDAVPGCMSSGCCSPFCDITEPNTCPGAAEGQECQAWFDPGDAPAGLENLGACALPS